MVVNILANTQSKGKTIFRKEGETKDVIDMARGYSFDQATFIATVRNREEIVEMIKFLEQISTNFII